MKADLFRELLGEDWERLHPAVRRVHEVGSFAGPFRVTHGSGRLARLLARLMGMPPETDRVDLTLDILPHPGGQSWRRRFGSFRFDSLQTRRGPLLVERVGPMEVRFRLVVDGDALDYRLQEVRFVLPLPRWLAPRISARVAGGDAARVQVRVDLPIVGRVAMYEGSVR